MIPQVRWYQVKWYLPGKGAKYIAYVQAPTKRLALWAARDELMVAIGGAAYAQVWREADKVTAWRMPSTYFHTGGRVVQR